METISANRAIEILGSGHRHVSELASRLDDDALVEPATIGGGDWSAKDLLGHLTNWEEIALRSLDEWRQGIVPWIESPDQSADEINAASVANKAPSTAEEIRAAFERIHDRLIYAIGGITEREWSEPAPFETEPGATLGAYLGDVLTGTNDDPFGHADAHLPDLRARVEQGEVA